VAVSVNNKKTKGHEAKRGEEILTQGLHSKRGKYTDLNEQTTRIHSSSTTKQSCQPQGCYRDTNLVIPKWEYLETPREKRLVKKKRYKIRSIANRLLAFTLLPDILWQ